MHTYTQACIILFSIYTETHASKLEGQKNDVSQVHIKANKSYK
jgi:hypothetical protein